MVYIYNNDLGLLSTRVGYLDYTGDAGNGYRLNLPVGVTFDNLSYALGYITIPDGYIIEPRFPTIIGTINTEPNMIVNISSIRRYGDNCILVQLDKTYTGSLEIAIGIRVVKQ